jgi:Protein phosphatase 2C
MTSTKHVWRAVAASCTGAAHEASGTANQDAYAMLTVGDVTAVAVADGHGDRAHFRSRHGARLAVDLAVSLMTDSAARTPGARALQTSLEDRVLPELLHEWRRRVLEHAVTTPFSQNADEGSVGSDNDAIVRTYGTTLIAIVGTPTAVGFAQIGDGDAVAVFADGDITRPLPKDPKLDGIHTTSLSQTDAAASMRVAVLDLDVRDLRLALAVTDGFAAPQLDGTGWWRQVGEELGAHLMEHGPGWIHDKLPGWLEEPARTGGDDTTMALLLSHGDDPAVASS